MFNSIRTKRGQAFAGPLSIGVSIITALFVIGILVFAFALAGGEMGAATDDTVAKEVINKTVQGASAFADFSPVLWIMAAVGILLIILFLAIAVVFTQRS